jgi:hypothetical protein
MYNCGPGSHNENPGFKHNSQPERDYLDMLLGAVYGVEQDSDSAQPLDSVVPA